MPNPNEVQPETPPGTVVSTLPSPENATTRTSEEMQMLLAQIADADKTPSLTTAQIDKIIEARNRAQELQREDNKDHHTIAMEEKKNQRHFLYIIVPAIVVIFIAVLVFKPDLISQLIAALFGGGGGYGIGVMEGKKNKGQE